MTDDRTIHAAYNGMQVVRYDRSGKWYLEPRDERLPRQRVGVAEAARMALWGVANANGLIWTGKHGGGVFDRHVARLSAARKEPAK